jgi:hypothetical protein
VSLDTRDAQNELRDAPFLVVVEPHLHGLDLAVGGEANSSAEPSGADLPWLREIFEQIGVRPA